VVPIAFSWPTRQNIGAYVFGNDRERGERSALALSLLLEVLATYTDVERIHVVCWSAGGRVVSRAVDDLRQRNRELTNEELDEVFRLGTVYFAAADVPREDFLEALPALNDMADRVVVTTSSKDDALRSAKVFMGGGVRIGQLENGTMTPEELAITEAADRLEVVDVSLGTDERGFDIIGHRYWFNHPWASSDIIFAVWGLSPEERGLQNGGHPLLWGIPADYPQRLRPEMVERISRGGPANRGSVLDSIP
jgi:esterase/lipase superfamily enzyme